MLHRTGHSRRVVGVAVLAASALVTAVGVSPAWANTAVTGSAYGYKAYNINLLGSAQSDTGPAQSVTLTSNASNSPQNASATSGTVSYGPAVLFTSDDVVTSSTGSVGGSGSVTSTSRADYVNNSAASNTGTEILTAERISSTCSATSTGATGSTAITSGTLRTDSGWDANENGSYTDPGDHAPVSTGLPSSLTTTTSTYYGHIHISTTQDDYWKIVLNEQSTVSGVLTVNAVHEYFGVNGSGGNDAGSALHGDLIIGQVVCGTS